MSHFVADGPERYAVVLREQMVAEKVILDEKLAVAVSDEDRQRLQGEIEELLRGHKEALRGLDRCLF